MTGRSRGRARDQSCAQSRDTVESSLGPGWRQKERARDDCVCAEGRALGRSQSRPMDDVITLQALRLLLCLLDPAPFTNARGHALQHKHRPRTFIRVSLHCSGLGGVLDVSRTCLLSRSSCPSRARTSQSFYVLFIHPGFPSTTSPTSIDAKELLKSTPPSFESKPRYQ